MLNRRLQCLPDLMNRLGAGALFVKPGNLLTPKFLWSKKIFEVKTDSLYLDDSLKPNSLNPADTVINSSILWNLFKRLKSEISHFLSITVIQGCQMARRRLGRGFRLVFLDCTTPFRVDIVTDALTENAAGAIANTAMERSRGIYLFTFPLCCWQ